jgi:hypothetical protein
MGDNASAERTAGEDSGLVEYVHTNSGIIARYRPGEIFSVPRRIEEASWEGSTLVLKFVEAGEKPVLAISNRVDIDYIFDLGQLTEGEEIEELTNRPVFAHLDNGGVYGFSYRRMAVDEASEHGVLVG